MDRYKFKRNIISNCDEIRLMTEHELLNITGKHSERIFLT